MRNQLIAGGAAVLLLASSLQVSAAIAMGTVASIDAKSGTITLTDGKVYTVNSSVVAGLMVGDFVTVTYAADGTGKLTASDVSKDEGYR
jgi:uncharacterized protein DUF1344